MATTIQIVDSTDGLVLDLNAGNYYVYDWTPAVSQYKQGGVYSESPTVDYKYIVDTSASNIVEEMKIVIAGSTQAEALSNINLLTSTLERLSRVWITNRNKYFLKVKLDSETDYRYAVLMSGRLENFVGLTGDLFDSGFYATKTDLNGKIYGLHGTTLYLERFDWIKSIDGNSIVLSPSDIPSARYNLATTDNWSLHTGDVDLPVSSLRYIKACGPYNQWLFTWGQTTPNGWYYYDVGGEQWSTYTEGSSHDEYFLDYIGPRSTNNPKLAMLYDDGDHRTSMAVRYYDLPFTGTYTTYQYVYSAERHGQFKGLNADEDFNGNFWVGPTSSWDGTHYTNFANITEIQLNSYSSDVRSAIYINWSTIRSQINAENPVWVQYLGTVDNTNLISNPVATGRLHLFWYEGEVYTGSSDYVAGIIFVENSNYAARSSYFLQNATRPTERFKGFVRGNGYKLLWSPERVLKLDFATRNLTQVYTAANDDIRGMHLINRGGKTGDDVQIILVEGNATNCVYNLWESSSFGTPDDTQNLAAEDSSTTASFAPFTPHSKMYMIANTDFWETNLYSDSGTLTNSTALVNGYKSSLGNMYVLRGYWDNSAGSWSFTTLMTTTSFDDDSEVTIDMELDDTADYVGLFIGCDSQFNSASLHVNSSFVPFLQVLDVNGADNDFTYSSSAAGVGAWTWGQDHDTTYIGNPGWWHFKWTSHEYAPSTAASPWVTCAVNSITAYWVAFKLRSNVSAIAETTGNYITLKKRAYENSSNRLNFTVTEGDLPANLTFNLKKPSYSLAAEMVEQDGSDQNDSTTSKYIISVSSIRDSQFSPFLDLGRDTYWYDTYQALDGGWANWGGDSGLEPYSSDYYYITGTRAANVQSRPATAFATYECTKAFANVYTGRFRLLVRLGWTYSGTNTNHSYMNCAVEIRDTETAAGSNIIYSSRDLNGKSWNHAGSTTSTKSFPVFDFGYVDLGSNDVQYSGLNIAVFVWNSHATETAYTFFQDVILIPIDDLYIEVLEPTGLRTHNPVFINGDAGAIKESSVKIDGTTPSRQLVKTTLTSPTQTFPWVSYISKATTVDPYVQYTCWVFGMRGVPDPSASTPTTDVQYTMLHNNLTELDLKVQPRIKLVGS